MSDDPLAAELVTALHSGPDRTVLRVEGEIDLLTAPDFAAALGAGLDAAPVLTVDLTEVGFIDSTGLRALLEARRRAVEGGGSIRLVIRDRGPVARLLELAGVLGLFQPENGQSRTG